MNPLDPTPRLPEASGAQVPLHGAAPRARIHPAVVVVVYWVLFLLLQRASALLAPTPAVSVWYFPAALSLALLLILGPAYTPVLLVAPFLGNLSLVLRPGGIAMADAVVNAVTHALGYGLAALAFTRARLSPRLRRVSDAGGLILAAVVAPLLVAIPAVISLQRGGALGPLHPIPAFRAFWFGDTLGVLTLAPFLLVWTLPVVRGEPPAHGASWRPERPVEAILQSMALVLGALLTVRMSSPGTLHLEYVLFLPLLWVALRGGLKAVSLAIPFLSLTLLTLLLWSGHPPSNLLDAQAFLVILFGTTLLMGSAVDAQGRALRAWQRAEEDRSRFFQMTRELLAIWDAEGRFQDLNPAWEAQLGYPRRDLLDTPLLELVHPEDREEVQAGHERLFRGEDPVAFESRFRSRDGSYRWLLWSATPLRDRDLAYGVARDITDRKEHEASVRSALREKEVLLKEIHHRVKNNLQVVSSLLRLQANSHGDPAVQAALQEAQERIHAIALIHQKLKHAPDPTRLDLAAYIQTLAERLVRSYASTPTLVDLQIQVDPVRLGPDEAVPLGLILNELVSNTLQHAFPPGEGGTIEIQVEALPGGQALLRVADSGVGLPKGIDLDCGGLGFQLVRALADQLGGTLELERRCGAAFRLTFTPHPSPNLHDL